MKVKNGIISALTGMMVASMVSTAWAQPPKMKMPTDIPVSITTPNDVRKELSTCGNH